MPTPDQIRILNALRRAADAYDEDATHAERLAGTRVPRHRLRQDATAARQLADQLTDEYRTAPPDLARHLAALLMIVDAYTTASALTRDDAADLAAARAALAASQETEP